LPPVPNGRPGSTSRLHRLRKNPFGLSFRGPAGEEGSRIVLKTLRARFLAPPGMTAWKGFSAPRAPPSGRGYRPREFVQALVWVLHAGGRRLENLRELGAEQEVLGELGLAAVPDAGTVGDWLRRKGLPGAEAIRQVSRRLVEACLQSEPEELILDVDATEIEAEKQEAQWTYNHVQGYMPLLGYVNGVCVGFAGDA